LIPSFIAPNTFAPYRFAVAFGAIPSHYHLVHPFTLDDLRAMNTPEAQLALIAAGEPVHWKTSDRIGRAVVAFRHLVGAMMRRR
jgi:hypothetical protein